MKYDAVVLGASAGGIQAISKLLNQLTENFPLTIFIVQHITCDSSAHFIKSFDAKCPLPVLEGKDKDEIKSGHIYVAPPGYHLLINEDKTLGLSIEEPVNFSRPSIDVLFESAADVFREKLIGIVLTGANKDGAAGLKKVKNNGGLALVQEPQEAEVSIMPEAAIEAAKIDKILPISGIIDFLSSVPYR